MLIDGRLLSQKILEELSKKVYNLQETYNKQPHLAIIKVGDDPATASYVRQKEKMGKQIGGLVSTYNYPESVSQEELMKSINFLQKKGEIDGLIIQLPLPKHLDEDALTLAVDADKDVDGFREDSDYVMPIAAAVIRILEDVFEEESAKKNTTLKEFTKWLKEQKIVVMGKGKTGGRPIIEILKKMSITPVIVDSKTQNREEVTKSADILVCAVGGKGTIINESMIKKDAILIGIGMHMGADGKLHGDYETEEISQRAAYYTPVPGGVGPVNAAMLFVNVVKAAGKNFLS
ncbi:MAG TPA: bifunctional 5,10-methylenetetrahydrofolate dehydrogenase/5,10-methenyltetrahydrofolate cyclohydrolase [Patescibacteria group bacterium]